MRRIFGRPFRKLYRTELRESDIIWARRPLLDKRLVVALNKFNKTGVDVPYGAKGVFRDNYVPYVAETGGGKMLKLCRYVGERAYEYGDTEGCDCSHFEGREIQRSFFEWKISETNPQVYEVPVGDLEMILDSIRWRRNFKIPKEVHGPIKVTEADLEDEESCTQSISFVHSFWVHRKEWYEK